MESTHLRQLQSRDQLFPLQNERSQIKQHHPLLSHQRQPRTTPWRHCHLPCPTHQRKPITHPQRLRIGSLQLSHPPLLQRTTNTHHLHLRQKPSQKENHQPYQNQQSIVLLPWLPHCCQKHRSHVK